MKTRNFPEIAFRGKGAFSGIQSALSAVAGIKRYLRTRRCSFLLITMNGAPFGRLGRPAAMSHPRHEPTVIEYNGDGTANRTDGTVDLI